MNLLDAQGIAYSILLAKRDCSVEEAAKKASKLCGIEEAELPLISGALIEFLLDLETPYKDVPDPVPVKGLLPIYKEAVVADSKGEAYELKGHKADPKEVIKAIEHYILK